MAVPKGKTSKARKRFTNSKCPIKCAATADTTTTRKLSARPKRRLTDCFSVFIIMRKTAVHSGVRSFL